MTKPKKPRAVPAQAQIAILEIKILGLEARLANLERKPNVTLVVNSPVRFVDEEGRIT